LFLYKIIERRKTLEQNKNKVKINLNFYFILFSFDEQAKLVITRNKKANKFFFFE
jgi:hypothetical protein